MYLCKIENGVVINRAYFDGPVPDGWIPEGETWVENEDGQIGWAYDGKTFIQPPEPEPAPVDPNAPPTLEERLAALEEKAARADKLEAALISKGAISAEAIEIATPELEANLKISG